MLYQLSYLGFPSRSAVRSRRESSGFIGGGLPPVQRSIDAKNEETSEIVRAVLRRLPVTPLPEPLVFAHSVFFLSTADGVGPREPAPEVDIATSARTEGTVLRNRRLPADRATPNRLSSISGVTRFRRHRRLLLGVQLGGLEPIEVNGETFAGEQPHHFCQRKSDDIGVGAHDLVHEAARQSLNSVATSLAPPFA